MPQPRNSHQLYEQLASPRHLKVACALNNKNLEKPTRQLASGTYPPYQPYAGLWSFPWLHWPVCGFLTGPYSLWPRPLRASSASPWANAQHILRTVPFPNTSPLHPGHISPSTFSSRNSVSQLLRQFTPICYIFILLPGRSASHRRVLGDWWQDSYMLFKKIILCSMVVDTWEIANKYLSI